jgi:heme oxygenase
MVSLKEAIAEKHSIAERKEFNQRMYSGNMSKEDYLYYLIQQYHIFKEIETRDLPSLTLARTENVKQDIVELGGFIFSPLKSTEEYTVYLSSIDQDSLLAHVYLNYLALVYGGQIMKSKVPGSGKMYEFQDKQTAITSIRAIQQDSWADEANIGLDYVIKIYDELQNYPR